MATYTTQPVGQLQGVQNNQFLPPGQTPLASLPQYGGSGGDATTAAYYAGQDFYQQFGRNPTQAELSQLIPAYLGTDPHVANLAGGKGAVAAYYTQQSQTPQSIYQQQQNQLQQQYTQNQGAIDPQVAQIFQQNLGRAPTSDEAQHFGMLIASGQDPYQIQQALQQTTEYQNKQTQDFTNQLGQQLQGTNADYFSKYILPSIQAQNAQAGRTQDSSGYQAQLANAAQQQNYQLQNYLAQVSAGQYGQSTQNAAQNYGALLGQQYGVQNAGISNALSNQASNQQYNQQLNLYQLQQQAYQNYLNSYGKRNGLASGLSGALSGGVSGAMAGSKFGPYGALAGGLLGAGLGGSAGAYL